MLFNSFLFIFIFLPITWFVYFYLNKKHLTEGSKGFLVLASLFFYSWWNIAYFPILVISMLFNYTVGISLTEKKKQIKINKKVLLTFGITANVSLLAYFKYADFLIENINTISNIDMPLLNIALPLAISFFTFQQIAYLVDSYRGETKEYDFLNYANFVTFFPQLIAGPIVHHSEMMPQFAKIKNKTKNYHNVALGLFIFSIGLFKKVVIADTFAIWANTGFGTGIRLSLFEAWGASLSYTFQLYFDFSAYTDMAIGIALLFNIRLPLNFNSPYKATNIQDFWHRWHITLSRFLKDYIYIPLGGNRKGESRTYVNLFATFVLGGIWHGAGWTFVVWGILHGLALVVHRAWKKLGFKMNVILAWFITFNFINIAWVFFRAKEIEDAVRIIVAMFNIDRMAISKNFASYLHYIDIFDIGFKGVRFGPIMSIYTIMMIILGFTVVLWFKNSNELSIKFEKMKKIPIFWYLFSVIALGSSLIVMSFQTGSDFLYFNF